MTDMGYERECEREHKGTSSGVVDKKKQKVFIFGLALALSFFHQGMGESD